MRGGEEEVEEEYEEEPEEGMWATTVRKVPIAGARE